MTAAYQFTPQPATAASGLPPALLSDPYLTSSLLQKAIRRSELELAHEAATILQKQRGNAVWRRLLVIAFEDIGVGSPDALVQIAEVATSSLIRAAIGGDEATLKHCVQLLANAPKERSSDYLICSAMSRPDLEPVREHFGRSNDEQRLYALADPNIPLTHRATAAWYASGLDGDGSRRLGKGDRSGLYGRFLDLGVPKELINATRIAVSLTREPIALMVPLLWVELLSTAGPVTVCSDELSSGPNWRGLPLYALDKHTRLGKRAIDRLLVESQDVHDRLLGVVPSYRASKAAQMAAFYLDAVPISPKLEWDGSAELEQYGLETDMLKIGVPLLGIASIMTAMRDSLDHLNAIRARVLEATYGEVQS